MSEKIQVDFTLWAPDAKEVKLAGTFNNWDPDAQPMERALNGDWKTCLMLEPGTYEYRFLVDGKWKNTFLANTVPNEYGTQNCIKIVRPETILIVDDEAHQRMLYQEELSAEGFQIILASNGREAIEKVLETVPDLIVLDIRMPVMDGLEAMGEIIRRAKDIPIIMHSAYSSYKDDFMSWAADDFVVKSADLMELKRKIRGLLFKKNKDHSHIAPVQQEKSKKLKKIKDKLSEKQKSAMLDTGTKKYRAICGAIAHRLRSEFVNIGGSIKSIRKLADQSVDIQEDLDMISKNIEYGQLIMQKLLDYLDMGKPQIKPTKILELMKSEKQLAEEQNVEMTNNDDKNYSAICGRVADNLKRKFIDIYDSVKDVRKFADSSDDVKEEIDIIERSLEYSQLLMRQLLDYLDIGKVQIESVDTQKLLEKIELLARPRLPSNVQLNIVVDQQMKNLIAFGNAEQLLEVMLELLQNAGDVLCEKGGIIKLIFEKKNGQIAISVKDNGPGIPIKIRKKILKEQVPSKSSLGLGLFLCSKVVNTMGGKLNFYTASRKGTTFTVLLPTAKNKKGN